MGHFILCQKKQSLKPWFETKNWFQTEVKLKHEVMLKFRFQTKFETILTAKTEV